MRTIILSLSPFLGETWTLNAQEIFDRTGGNTGNLAFQYAVSQHVTNSQIQHMGSSPEQLRAAGDIIVIPLANQLGPHTDLGSVADLLEKTQLPVIGIGLGAQAADQSKDIKLTEGTERWLRVLASLSPTKGPNIGVRGEYTKTQIEKLGIKDAAVVTGCPSNFISSEPGFEKRISAKMACTPSRIAVTAGIPYIPNLSSVERDLVDLVTLTGGEYIVQHGLDMIRLACDEWDVWSPESLETYRKYIAPHLSTDEFKRWCHHYATAYTDIREWIAKLRHYDFVVGTRFHGAMCAIQAGTPGAVIAHDSRTLEMCNTMAIPVIRDIDIPGGLTRRNLTEIFTFDEDLYLRTRHRLGATYLNLLESAGIKPTERLRKAAAAVVSPELVPA
ncbi:polysaccharide pyruvyl transferase family protein [Terrihabitans sp. B22-R8]|uniref:polysaccharide pyruvyl transferase family protein n=1 Tax=Terrihabitans sp. B22-R8 TaxID=3425128 RepID=UPI00403D295B